LAIADRVVTPSAAEERAGWTILDVVDRRKEDPRSGLYSERLVDAVRRHEGQTVLCVLNRKGRSRLLACTACGEVARCERCKSSVVLDAGGQVASRRCDGVP